MAAGQSCKLQVLTILSGQDGADSGVVTCRYWGPRVPHRGAVGRSSGGVRDVAGGLEAARYVVAGRHLVVAGVAGAAWRGGRR